MRVAYLANLYPHVSHSFIRREIAGLERLGIAVERYSLRPTIESLPTAADREESARTFALTRAGAWAFFTAFLGALTTRPLRLGRALAQAIRCGRRSERGILLHLAYLAEALLLRQRLARQGIGHLHAHFGTNSATVALLTRTLGGPPFSFTVHGPEEFDRPEAWSLREKIAQARFVVGISSFGRSQLMRWCDPAEWNKLQVVRCGVDATFLAEPPTAVPDRPRVVCVGRLAEQKGQLIALDALARLQARGIACDLVLAGDGPMRGIIEARIRDLGLGERVRITGWINDTQIRDELLASRALVLPSFAEGLPVVIMEALALGRPVVSTYVAGIPELVRPGRNGWLVPAGSAPRLARALERLLATPTDRLTRLGADGRARVERQHDANREAERLAGLFLQAAGVRFATTS